MKDTLILVSGKLVKEINCSIKIAIEVNYMKKVEDIVYYVYEKVGSYYFQTQGAFELYWKMYIQKYVTNIKKKEKN